MESVKTFQQNTYNPPKKIKTSKELVSIKKTNQVCKSILMKF